MHANYKKPVHLGAKGLLLVLTITGGLFLSSAPHISCTPLAHAAVGDTGGGETVDIITPRLTVPVPNLKFTDVTVVDETCNTRTLDIPFLADYISGIYTFAVGIASILAATMMMIGGFQYLTAGGDSARVTAAKSRMSDAMVGLFLSLGVYTILLTVNPELLKMNGIQVDVVKKIEFQMPDEALVDSEPGTKSGIPVNPDDFVKPQHDCLDIRSRIHPVNIPNMKVVGDYFCQNRPEGSEWKIRGGGYRPATLGAQKFIKACLYRKACNPRTSSNGTLAKGFWKRDEAGVLIPNIPGFENYKSSDVIGASGTIYETIYNFALPGFVEGVSQSAHGSGLAIDVYCEGTDVSKEGIYKFHAPCQVLLEKAFKAAGYCRHKEEGWHFEHTANKMTPTLCVDGFSVGTVGPVGSVTHSYAGCSGTYNWSKKSCSEAESTNVVEAEAAEAAAALKTDKCKSK